MPPSLLVVGGGYIGLELGTVYAALGSAVTVVEMTGGLLPGADRDLVDVLAKRLAGTMKAIRLNTRVVQMKPEAKGIRASFEGEGDPKEQLFDRVLVAVGRRPNSNIPGLDRTRVGIDARGFIKVDEQRRTEEPSIFAIGDVVGEPMLAHKASHEGRVAVEVMAGENVAFAPRAIPAVVFTDPEIAWAGLTEAQRREPDGGDHEVSVGRLGPRDHARSHRRPDEAHPRSHERCGARRGPGRSRRGRADCRRRARDRDGRQRDRPEAVHPSASDADRNGDGVCRGLLRSGHTRVSTQEDVASGYWINRPARPVSISLTNCSAGNGRLKK